MKVKTEKQRKGIFDGCIFAIAQGSATFNAKRNVRKIIISNGGVVSYLVTKRCNYLILLDEKSASLSVESAIKTAHKYAIPVLSADFVEKCIEEDGILSSTTPFIISSKFSLKKTINHAFNHGKIATSKVELEGKKPIIFSGKLLKVWDYLGPAMPPFYEVPYLLAKYTVLKSTTRTNFACTYYASVEIHVKANNDNSEHKYCVFVHSGSNHNDFVKVESKYIPNLNKSSKTCRLTNDSEVALEMYTKILKTLESPPRSMTACKLMEESIPTFIGSTELQKVIENLNVTKRDIDVEVKDIVGHLWKELFMCIGISSTFDSTAHSINNIDEAENCLLKIWKSDDKNGAEFQDLVKKYTNLIPNQKEVDFTVVQNIHKQLKILKLLRDVAVVSEINPDGILGAYKALNCGLSLVNKDSPKYSSIANTIVEDGPKIELINVFAIRRAIEEENFKFHLANKKMLFHGSSIENYIGILSSGLLPMSGLPGIEDQNYLGNGIYFTDSIKKCLHFSTVNNSRKSRLMLIAEVALGNCYETNSRMPHLTCPPEGYDSVIGVVGSQFKENEFVVYSINQQRLIYLIEFKMPEDTLPTAHVKSEINLDNFWTCKKLDTEVTPTVSLEQILSLKEQNPGAVTWGLLDSHGRSIPLNEIHVRGRILDLAAKIVVIQTYYNSSPTTLEEFKFVFPLNDETAVCGFEAFIGDKHVIGEIQEKKKAHAMYKEAVSKGHGGYLMDEQKQETFSITIGNLPPKTAVIIKISYVTELSTEGEHMAFRLPRGITGGRVVKEQSLKMAINMPFVIKRISSRTNNIQIKKTDTMATVQLVRGEDLNRGFELIIELAEIHVPRMWVERHPDYDSQACMLTFYPSFDIEEDVTEKSVIIMLDASNSMSGEVFEVAKTLSLLCLHKLPSDWNFNVVVFGTVIEELFPSCQPNNMDNAEEAKKFLENATSRMGSSDVYQAIRSLFLLAPSGNRFQNVFLITDGHILSPEGVTKAAAANRLKTRIFTFGVGSEKNSCDTHFLKKLAFNSAGDYEEFDIGTISKWIHKVNSQLEKASQAVVNDVRVEWQQFDENVATFVQAPMKFPPIFHGNRLVVYGFIPNCTLATLKACVNGFEVSTVVSTSELSQSTGEVLHRLTARAIIRDWNHGYQDDVDFNNKFIKILKRWDIINTSKKYHVLSPLTSFVAIEQRNKDDSNVDTDSCLLINDLLNNEEVDHLPYIDFDSVLDTNISVVDKEIPVLEMEIIYFMKYDRKSIKSSPDNYEEQSYTIRDKSTPPQNQLKTIPTTVRADSSEKDPFVPQLAAKAWEDSGRIPCVRERHYDVPRGRESTRSREHNRSRSRQSRHLRSQNSDHENQLTSIEAREERTRSRSRERGYRHYQSLSISEDRDHLDHDYRNSDPHKSGLATKAREKPKKHDRYQSRSRSGSPEKVPKAIAEDTRILKRRKKDEATGEAPTFISKFQSGNVWKEVKSEEVSKGLKISINRIEKSYIYRPNSFLTLYSNQLVGRRSPRSSSSLSTVDIDPPVNCEFNNKTFLSHLNVSKEKRSKPPLIILSELRGKPIEGIETARHKSTLTHLGSIPTLTTLKHHLIASESTILNAWLKHVLKKGWGTSEADFKTFQFVLLKEITDKHLNLNKEFDFWREQLNDGSFDISTNKEDFIEILDASGIKSLGLTLKTTTIRLCCTLEKILKTFIKLGALLPTTEINGENLELNIDECVEQFLKALGNAQEPLVIKMIMAVAFVIKFTEMYPFLFNSLQLKNYLTSNTMFAFTHANLETFILCVAKRTT